MNESIISLTKAAESGDAQAQYELGVIYALGEEVEQDFTKSREWYLKSAEQGDFEASYTVGTMFLDGQGGEINKEKGLKYLEFATTATKYDLGALSASKLLKDIYKEGYFGIEPSVTKAEKFKQIYIRQNELFGEEL